MITLSFPSFLRRGRICFNALRCLSSNEPLTICSEENGIRKIIMNNPKKRNALSMEMMTSLYEDITKDINNKDLRVIILSANGPVFSSGHDLKELVNTRERSEHAKIFNFCSKLMETIQDVPVPVLCQVDSLATAAGCQLVASCDIAVASTNASFCTPGVNIGLFCSTPAVALSRSVPRKLALDMLLTGRKIDAQNAYEQGLISRLVSPEDLEKETNDIAKTICEKSRSVIAIGKAGFHRQIVKDRNSAYIDASAVMVQNMSMQDGKGGIEAFLEKRDPNWTHTV